MTQIIDSVIYPEWPKYAEDSEEGNVTVQNEKHSWNTAQQPIHTLKKFMEQTLKF